MDKRTLKALKGSIAKWQKIVLGKGSDYGARNCPLCQLFADERGKDGDFCSGCPVKESTGKHCCNGTPYQKEWYAQLPASEQWSHKATTKKLREAALHELLFLESLLPKRGGRNVG